MERELGRELVRETREQESQPGEESTLPSFSSTVVVCVKAVVVGPLSSFPISSWLLSSNAEWRKSCWKYREFLCWSSEVTIVSCPFLISEAMASLQ